MGPSKATKNYSFVFCSFKFKLAKVKKLTKIYRERYRVPVLKKRPWKGRQESFACSEWANSQTKPKALLTNDVYKLVIVLTKLSSPLIFLT